MTGGETNTATEGLARTARESYQVFFGTLAAMQEPYMKLARYSAGIFLWGAERQREAMRTMLGGAFGAYAGLLRAPASSPSNGATSTDGGDPDLLPIEDYDQLSVGEITGELGELSTGEVEELKEYETQNKNRPSLIERFDRSLI